MPKKIRHWIGLVWKKCPVSTDEYVPKNSLTTNETILDWKITMCPGSPTYTHDVPSHSHLRPALASQSDLLTAICSNGWH